MKLLNNEEGIMIINIEQITIQIKKPSKVIDGMDANTSLGRINLVLYYKG